MTESAAVFGPWANFYVMTGSAAAALTGLMFVVITLVTGEQRTARQPEGISAFSTPTVLHFAAALFISAVLCAPWRTLTHPAILLGIASIYMIVHLVRVTFIARRLTSYRPDAEDWTWFTILPLVAYVAILAGAILLVPRPVDALFAFGGGAVCLLFIGIHNAWDVVTYLTIGEGRTPPPAQSDED